MVESAASSSRRRSLHWTLSVLRSAGVRRGAAAGLPPLLPRPPSVPCVNEPPQFGCYE